MQMNNTLVYIVVTATLDTELLAAAINLWLGGTN